METQGPFRNEPTAEEKIQPTGNDPTPEERKGDSRFLPVVIAAAVALIVILVLAIFVIKGKGSKIVPSQPSNHPTSSLILHSLLVC